MRQTITVSPLGQGWMVQHEACDLPMVFRSGSRAEASAHHLAETLADAGQPSQVTIYLRDGSLAGRFVSTPPHR